MLLRKCYDIYPCTRLALQVGACPGPISAQLPAQRSLRRGCAAPRRRRLALLMVWIWHRISPEHCLGGLFCSSLQACPAVE